MKLLIVSITAGEGHNAMGHAIEAYVQRNYNNCEVKMIDLYKDKHRFASFVVDQLQSYLVKFFPRIMHLDYKLSMKKKPDVDHNFSLKMGLVAKDTFLKEVVDYQPDIIFSTHTFTSALISYCIKNKLIYCKNYSIIPDYVFHPDPEANMEMDYIFTPDEDLKEKLAKIGVPEEKIRAYGIPVHPKFLEPHNKTKLISKYRIDPNKLTVLVSNGGKDMGVASNFKILKSIYDCSDINILVVNGNNIKSKKAIDRYLISHPNPHVTNFGFVSEIDELMTISDVLIGKAGGSSLTEAMIMDLPVIVAFNPPYQEYWTMRKFEEIGIITHLKNVQAIPDYLDYLVKNPEELKLMKRNIKKFKKEDATERIVDLMMRNI